MVKTGVLVVGYTPAGISAAIQSAHSGVKTVLADPGEFESLSLTDDDKKIFSGTYELFTKRVEGAQKYPVTPTQVFSPSFTGLIFKAWADTVKNLSLMKKASVKSIKKEGKNWLLVLSNKKEVKADVVIDATNDGYVATLAGVKFSTPARDASAGDAVYSSNIYRTGVAILNRVGFQPATLPLKDLISATENFIVPGNRIYPPTLAIGQAAGATGAYCSFFKTSTQKLNVRLIQSELIGYKSRLIHFDDVTDRDSNIVQIESVALTGILKGKMIGGKFCFLPDSSVSSEEIKLPVKELYSRSQIWFLDNHSSGLTLKEVLSLMKFTASRGDELNREVEKGWRSSLKLPGKFDLNRPVTRRELAVLFAVYLKPFNVMIDMEGNLKR